MTLESARKFLEQIKTDKEFLSRLQKAGDEEKNKIIEREGFSFTGEELDNVRTEVSDDELSAIIGGIALQGCNATGGWLVREDQVLGQKDKAGHIDKRG